MAVVLFDHPGVRMTECFGDDDQRGAIHDCKRSKCVAQAMEVGWWINRAVHAGVRERSRLMRGEPPSAVLFGQHRIARFLAGSELLEESLAFLGQWDVAVAPGFRAPDVKC